MYDESSRSIPSSRTTLSASFRHLPLVKHDGRYEGAAKAKRREVWGRSRTGLNSGSRSTSIGKVKRHVGWKM